MSRSAKGLSVRSGPHALGAERGCIVSSALIGWESGKRARQRQRVSRHSSSPARVQFDCPI